MTLQLGVIADDLTGGTDIASMLAQQGWNVLQLLGVPEPQQTLPDVDAIVISLKIRSCSVAAAIQLASTSLQWLRHHHCPRYFFKYCSTFDSTPQGNIGPITDSLLDLLHCPFTILCPALPLYNRTVIHGHLFVEGKLLHESGMQNHPTNPMLHANLCQLMAQQAQGEVGLVNLSSVQQGKESICQRLHHLQQAGYRYAVIDILNTHELSTLAAALEEMPLVTGSSGLGAAMANRARQTTSIPSLKSSTPTQARQRQTTPPHGCRTAILCGSCSQATQQQVAYYRTLGPTHALEITRCLYDLDHYVTELLSWVMAQNSTWAPLLYSTQTAKQRKHLQERYSQARISLAIEQAFATIARRLIEHDFSALIIAGGETAGAVVYHLGIHALQIGAAIAPGVPWVKALYQHRWFALKSGNFGEVSFFQQAQLL